MRRLSVAGRVFDHRPRFRLQRLRWWGANRSHEVVGASADDVTHPENSFFLFKKQQKKRLIGWVGGETQASSRSRFCGIKQQQEGGGGWGGLHGSAETIVRRDGSSCSGSFVCNPRKRQHGRTEASGRRRKAGAHRGRATAALIYIKTQILITRLRLHAKISEPFLTRGSGGGTVDRPRDQRSGDNLGKSDFYSQKSCAPLINISAEIRCFCGLYVSRAAQ